MNEYNTLKLCDFGLSKKLSDLAKPEEDQTKPKSGTPYYMAPELFSDEGVYSFYSDMWALGCVLYELATGKPPFAATGLKDLITEICEKDPPEVEGFSPLFNDLIKRLLEKDPAKRIYWEHLRKHPFWAKEINQRKIPRQPQFDKYLKEHRDINPEEFHEQQMKNAYFIPNIQYKAPKKIDPLRVSQSISKNMLKDMNKDAYGGNEASAAPADISLKNRDQEIQFAGGEDNDNDPAEKEVLKKKMGGGVEKESDLQTIEKNEPVSVKESKKNEKPKGRPKNNDNNDNGIKKDTTNVGPMGLDPNA